ncbi:MAG: C-terminal helicase domain-containing protein [Verrucomicrobiales bacterium]
MDAEDLDDLMMHQTPKSRPRRNRFSIVTAAGTIHEFKAEIEILKHLESLLCSYAAAVKTEAERAIPLARRDIHACRIRKSPVRRHTCFWCEGGRQVTNAKARHFLEHRDTLNYLEDRISTLLGTKMSSSPSMAVSDARSVSKFRRLRHDPEVKVLIATDAAGEGINLQRAHLMVNYDLLRNPNRLEQRFGRIHRIGQTEVCHLWNLIADETREGEVYRTLLDKLG